MTYGEHLNIWFHKKLTAVTYHTSKHEGCITIMKAPSLRHYPAVYLTKTACIDMSSCFAGKQRHIYTQVIYGNHMILYRVRN